VTVYRSLEPRQISLCKVYGAMDVPAPSAERTPTRSWPTIAMKAGKTLQQKRVLESFGRAYPGTDLRYLEPTVYRVAVRFHYRIDGDLAHTYTIGDSVFFTVRRNDLVERALHQYYRTKDSCLRPRHARCRIRPSIPCRVTKG
jgi:hypothetical protein